MLMVRWLHAWILAGKVVLYSYCKAGCEVIVACVEHQLKLNGEPVLAALRTWRLDASLSCEASRGFFSIQNGSAFDISNYQNRSILDHVLR